MKVLNENNTGLHLWALWLVGVLLTLAWDWAGWDRNIMQLWGSTQGFPLKNHPLFELWLHDYLRQVGWGVYLVLWTYVLAVRPWRHIFYFEGVWLMVWVTVNLFTISLIKNTSQTSCPWSVINWGGVANYVSHWEWGLVDGGPGRCFPGGHASAAWAFVPWILAAWWPVRTTTLTRSRLWVSSAFLVAVLLTGVTQTVRGAHYPSHTAWTALICTGLGLMAWTFWHWKHRRYKPATQFAHGENKVCKMD